MAAWSDGSKGRSACLLGAYRRLNDEQINKLGTSDAAYPDELERTFDECR
jgi:hypothetical protein